MCLDVTLGQVAYGKNRFFERKEIILEFWNTIKAGNNILISAPRRVGKTSIIRHIESNPAEGYKVVFITTESVNNENDFYKRIYDEINQKFFAFQQKVSKVKNKITDFAQGFEYTYADVTLKHTNLTKEASYYDKLLGLLDDINKDFSLIIMIDEFAQTVQNINKYVSTEKAVQFLQGNRELRQILLHKKIYFVYAGSIGLRNIANKIGSDTSINDLRNIQIGALSRKTGEVFIEKLTCGLETSFSKKSCLYLLDKVEWIIPYFVQILVNEVHKYCVYEEITEVTDEIVDIAFEKLIYDRNDYFEHWKKRLNDSFDNEEEVKFAYEILNYIAIKQEIAISQVKQIAEGYNLNESTLAHIVNSLEYDGYITEKSQDEHKYGFVSPILKRWWYKHVAVFY